MSFTRRAAICGLLLLAAGSVKAEVPEPKDYWTGPMHGETPATLAGAHVVHTDALAELLAQGGTVLIDVAMPPERPVNLPAETLWKPAPHQSIVGSVWMPGAGAGDLAEPWAAFFRERLKTLTDGDPERRIVFYCHPKCWASWNAAKRAISFGYRNVYWDPDGMEGWQGAGRPLFAPQPETPAQAAR